jgi:hypothetical protein
MRRWVGGVLMVVAVLGLSGCATWLRDDEPELLFADYFANTNSPGWWQGRDGDAEAETPWETVWEILDGRYYGQLAGADSYYYNFNPTVTGLTDFRVQATTGQIGTAGDCSWGIILRAGNDGFYAFEISADGYVQFSVWAEDYWEDIYGWAQCAAIRPGQTNQLRIDVRGSSFTLYVNGTTVAQVTDATVNSGSVGFIVETWDDAYGGAWFDDLEVWTLGD